MISISLLLCRGMTQEPILHGILEDRPIAASDEPHLKILKHQLNEDIDPYNDEDVSCRQ